MSKLYNIRKLTSNNETGDAHGITIPNKIIKDNAGLSTTYFSISTGKEVSHTIQIEIIDSMNAVFKQMSIDFPAEQYPQIKYFQLQLREKVNHAVEPLNNSVILISGCK